MVIPVCEILTILPYGTIVNLTLSGEFYCKFVVGNNIIKNAFSNIKTDVMRIEWDITNHYYNIDFVFDYND